MEKVDIKKQAVLDFLDERILNCMRGFKAIDNPYRERIMRFTTKNNKVILREYWQQKQKLIKNG